MNEISLAIIQLNLCGIKRFRRKPESGGTGVLTPSRKHVTVLSSYTPPTYNHYRPTLKRLTEGVREMEGYEGGGIIRYCRPSREGDGEVESKWGGIETLVSVDCMMVVLTVLKQPDTINSIFSYIQECQLSFR